MQPKDQETYLNSPAKKLVLLFCLFTVFCFSHLELSADLLGGVSSKFKTHLAKLSRPWREEVREELSSEEAAVIYRYFWWAQQPLGAKGDPRGIQGGSKHLPTRD